MKSLSHDAHLTNSLVIGERLSVGTELPPDRCPALFCGAHEELSSTARARRTPRVPAPLAFIGASVQEKRWDGELELDTRVAGVDDGAEALVVCDVIDRLFEMLRVGNRNCFAADGPEAALGGETVALHVGAAFLFGETHVVPRVVVDHLCQRVKVDAVDGDDAELDAPFLEGADEFRDGALALLRS